MTDPANSSRAARIEAALRAAFTPQAIAVVDESHRHAGHAGARAEGETHYAVLLVADAFDGQGRVARHRAVNATLAAEFATGLHALALTLRTPAEAAAAARPAAP
ncbi:BolA family protein, partial [Acidisphaera rubrifaciens]|uniref:BolA family protein n=1 Tax=Acidisphaera rubrifaciens TaxID=50715 RepID=UPI0009FFCD2F